MLSFDARAGAPEVAELERVVRYPDATIVDGQGFELPDGSRVIVGRYRERPDSKWLFPIAIGPAFCDDGKPGCVHPIHLGQAAKRITALALVDLDAPSGQVTSLQPNWHIRRISGPENAKWPAVILAIERDQDELAVDLVIVSLRATKAERSGVLFDGMLEQRYLQPDEAELARAPRPTAAISGKVLSSVRFDRSGKERRMIVTMQPIDGPWNRCSRTNPEVVTYVLDGARYRERPGPPPRPCE